MRRQGSIDAGRDIEKPNDQQLGDQGARGHSLNAQGIAALLPHGVGLSLLDAVTFWDDASLEAVSRRHGRPMHPLARDATTSAIQAAGGGQEVSTVLLIEYAAQAAAVHIHLMAAPGQSVRGGVLAMVRDVRIHAATLGDALAGVAGITIEVKRRGGLGLGFLYEFAAQANHVPLASGKLGIVLQSGSWRTKVPPP